MWNYPKVLAHRGGGSLAPENTLAALRCGLEHGFRAVEFDVMLTQDEVPVLMHDPELGRTVAGRGQISQLDADELTSMDAGRWFGAAFEGETVPTFVAVLEFCQQQGIWMNIEIKPAPGHEVRTGQIVAEVTRRKFASRPKSEWPLLSSFSHEALLAAQKAAPDLPRGILLDELGTDWMRLARSVQASAVHTNQRYLTTQLAQEIKRAGFGLFCYTVNEPKRASQLLEWGVDAFCTDRIDLIGPAYPL